LLDLTRTPDDLLAPTQAVVKAALAAVPQLSPNVGHTFATTATLDPDLAPGTR